MMAKRASERHAKGPDLIEGGHAVFLPHRTDWRYRALMIPQVSSARVVLAVAAGGATAALVWCFAFFFPMSRYQPSLLLLAFVVAAGVWIAGSSLIGVPIWIVLHRRSIRSPLAAALLGLLLGFVVSLALATHFFGLLPNGSAGSSYGNGYGLLEKSGVLTEYGWQMALRSAAIISMCSAVGGVVTWRIAYGTSRTDAI